MFANGFADSLDVIELGIACDLAREDDEIAFRRVHRRRG